jgi:DNA-binding response OmpR family regulator
VNDKRRVLVVDDEARLREVIGRLLRSRFDVTTCASIASARQQLAQIPFDAVVCDVMLDDGYGTDFFYEVRAVAPEKAARFVFASAAVDDVRVRARLEATGAPYVCKPFVISTFLEIVTCLSEGRAPRRTSSARRLWVAHP